VSVSAEAFDVTSNAVRSPGNNFTTVLNFIEEQIYQHPIVIAAGFKNTIQWYLAEAGRPGDMRLKI
jgi:hypothetical protein